MQSAISTIVRILRRHHTKTMLEQFSNHDAFKILVGTVLSARTKDTTTIPIVNRLFKKYKSPKDFANMPVKKLESAIYGVGFYKQKARRIKAVSKILLEKHRGKVPQSLEALLELPGVGRKTANCVLVYAFRKPAIPVDTHVHRVSNRIGLVRTRKPEETETALMKSVPRKYWIELNELFVRHGQTICLPVSPFCSRCPIRKLCKRVGVKKSR